MTSQFKCKICHNIFSLWIDAAACCACASPIEIHDIDTYRRLFTPLYSQNSDNLQLIPEVICALSENQFKVTLPRPVVAETLCDAAYLINSQFLVTADTNSLMIDGSNLSNNELKNILFYTEDPIVSVDINNSSYSCTFDSQMTSVIGRMVKIIGWYDNETGYSSRLIDLINLLIKKNYI